MKKANAKPVALLNIFYWKISHKMKLNKIFIINNILTYIQYYVHSNITEKIQSH